MLKTMTKEEAEYIKQAAVRQGCRKCKPDSRWWVSADNLRSAWGKTAYSRVRCMYCDRQIGRKWQKIR